MPALPIPNRCIWCCRQPPDVEFDTSHVIPECFGNEAQTVLPPGIVCKGCNREFGRKLQRALIADALLRPILVHVGPIDPGDGRAFRNHLFDPAEYPESGRIARRLNMSVIAGKDGLSVDLRYEISGRHDRKYRRKDLALLSRAVHKMGFEALAWRLYVQRCDDPVDLFSPEFDAVRAWTRRGEPLHTVRPFLVQPPAVATPPHWTITWSHPVGQGVVEIDLFGMWYAMTLTTDTWLAQQELGFWFHELQDERHEALCFGDKISPFRRPARRPLESANPDS